MKIKIVFLIIIMLSLTLISCEKEEIVSDGSSPELAVMGTPIPSDILCRDSVILFIQCMDSLRSMSDIPAYYDSRIIDMSSDALSNTYYVGNNGIKFQPIILGKSEQTILSVSDWFIKELDHIQSHDILPDADSSYAGTESAFTGRWGKWPRINEYDVYSVRIKPGTGCQTGRFKLELTVLVFCAEYY